ncbi:hypothetical protein BHM03_00061350, partial [Ensete ventricosum]
PPELGKNSPLVDIEVDDNMISGELPDGLCDRGAFNSIVVFNNTLTGRIPPSLGKCSKLNNFQIHNNRFSGELPDGIWSAMNLTTVMVSNNTLSGTLPEKLPWNLTRLEIENNRFTGSIPASADRLQVNGGDLAAWELTSFQSLDITESGILRGIREENVVGGGGAGKVFKIDLGDRGVVAVKKIWNCRNLGSRLEKQFQSEVQILGSIRHKNIIKLLCCLSGADSKLLVYEYMENGSLDRWLHRKRARVGGEDRSRDEPLDWPTRLEIAVGAARGLCYMHHDCSPPVIHRDVKSSNILLDSEFNARVADFGLARMLVKPGEPDTVSVIAGSFGYMAPECGYSTRLNEKVDVYSFGVVLLELTTGREANNDGEQCNLAEWAWRQLEEGAELTDAIDTAIRDSPYMDDMTTVFKLGFLCTETLPSRRPSMKEVLQILLRCHRPGGVSYSPIAEQDVAAPLLRANTGSRRQKPSHGGGGDHDDNIMACDV